MKVRASVIDEKLTSMQFASLEGEKKAEAVRACFEEQKARIRAGNAELFEYCVAESGALARAIVIGMLTGGASPEGLCDAMLHSHMVLIDIMNAEHDLFRFTRENI